MAGVLLRGPMTARILVAAADPETASILELALAREGHDVQVAATVDHAMRGAPRR